MKILTLIFGLSLVMSSIAKELASCSEQQTVELDKAILDAQNDGYKVIYNLYNEKNKIVGYFALNNESGIMAEVWEGIYEEGTTVASVWYYWDNEEESTQPEAWVTKRKYYLSQDEGKAYFKVISKANKTTKAEFKIIGWSEDNKEKVMRESVVTFKPR